MSWYRCYLRWRHGTRRLPRPLLGFLAFGCVAAVVTLARIGALSQQLSMGQRKYEMVPAASRDEREPVQSVRLAESAVRPIRSVALDENDRGAALRKDIGSDGENVKYRARQKPLHPPADGRNRDSDAKHAIEPEPKSGNVPKVLSPSGDISNSNIAEAPADVTLDRLVIRGVRPEVLSLYRQPDFTCLRSGETVPRSRINDDYCDCADGTDEPGTAACSNGIFHCRGRDLPSSRVGDGVCDCCDGSDEQGSGKPVFWLPETVQRVLGRYQAPCGNTCR